MSPRRLSLVAVAVVIGVTVGLLVRQIRDPNGEKVGWARGDRRVDGTWKVISLGRDVRPAASQPGGSSDFAMRGGRLSWEVCNGHSGLYRVENSRIRFRGGTSTTAFCPDPFEDQLRGALSGGPWRFRREGDRLEIETVVGPLVLRRAPHCDPLPRRPGQDLKCR